MSFVVFGVLFSIFCGNVLSDICSNNSKFDCVCKSFTDQITHLPLTIADCGDAGIETLPTDLGEDLSILDVSSNEIGSLDAKLASKSLVKLILSYNNVSKVAVGFFDNLPNLKYLDLSNNFLTSFDNAEVFKKLPNLRYLDLSYNNFKSLPEFIFSPLKELRRLHLSYNDLGEYLMPNKAVLGDVLGVTPNLTHLDLSGLGLKELHTTYFDHFVELKTLSLEDNNLTTIPTIPYTIEFLDLSGNRLTVISAKYLNYHSLKVLKLNRMNTLTSIHHYAFYNLVSLEKLYITDCANLKEFSDLAFDDASKDIHHHPKFLSLARNGLESLNETYKYFFKRMEHIDLIHNPWNCDCNILWLKDFAQELNRPHELRCSYPDQLKHKKILDLEPSDLKDCFPAIYGKKSHRALIVVLAVACVTLCGLIFYLLRYPVNGFAGRHRIGPNSPYVSAPTTEPI
ncbi:unnamed protein product [Phyllotreta striolata]|uniref:LRRCT domain-containing protein n=1 Tax=Phyllotreta striolata TaxID=444603 RepID=A0A9N9TPW9_PHYSR|nr:unnamed protein product [Phyllotreta striolata]